MNSNKSHLKVTSNLTEWSEKAVKYIAKIVGGGTPSTKISEYWNGDIPWITPKDLSIQQHKYICKGLRNITPDGLNKSSAKIIPSNSVILSTRAPVGYIAISRRDITTNQGCHSLIPNNDMDTEFLYYLLLNNVEYLKSQSNGSTFGELSAKVLSELRFKLPTLKEQKAIAKILSDLDSKIELNEKMNKTLEAIAQAIFKHWFIDFEFPNEEGKPYKSSGGEMVDSELGSIPKGWKVKYFKDIVHLNMGVSPKGTSYNTDGIGVPLLNGAADFSSGIIEPKKFTTNPVRMCKKGDLLFCIRATIGNLTYSDKAYCIGRGVAALDPVSEVYKEYSYFTLEYGLNNLILKASGSVIKGLSKDDLLLFKIVTPTDKIISKFHLLVATIFSRIQYLTVENHSLSNIRDSLLPKLMTGKIRVPMEDEHE